MATIYGDTEGTLEARGKGQTLVGSEASYNFLCGDAYAINNSTGGNDVLIGGALSEFNHLFGDAFAIQNSRGGNDVLIGGNSSSYNILYGDAFSILGSHGGNDQITGGDNCSLNMLFGDASAMFGSKGGNDVLKGGNGSFLNILCGDAFQMSGSQGGNDILIAGANVNSDARAVANYLFGDAIYNFSGKTVCGNDRLISDTGDDDMWGDIAFTDYMGTPVDLARVKTGRDVFVFSANNGNDRIHDFRQGEDKIELQGLGVDSFDALMAASHLSQQDTSTVITFGANTITVVGVTDLNAADFIFT